MRKFVVAVAAALVIILGACGTGTSRVGPAETLDVQPPLAVSGEPTAAAAGREGITLAAAGVQPERGVIKGQIFDERGRPLRGVPVEVSLTVASSGVAQVATDAEGRYRFANLQALPYRVYAQIQQLEYNGKFYSFSLEPKNAPQGRTYDPTAGAVVDFVWKIRGATAGSDRNNPSASTVHGGSLLVNEMDGPGFRFPRGSTFVFTFTPKGPLIDGSEGAVLRRTLDELPGSSIRHVSPRELIDVPLGRYGVKGVVEHPDGRSVPFYLADGKAERPRPVPEFILDFMPNSYASAPAVRVFELRVVPDPEEALPPTPRGIRPLTGTVNMRGVGAGSLAEAVLVAPPATLRGAVETGDEWDVLAIALRAGETLKVEGRVTMAYSNFWAYLYQPYNENVKDSYYYLSPTGSTSGASQPLTVSWTVVQSGVYYLKLWGYASSEPNFYEVKLTIVR